MSEVIRNKVAEYCKAKGLDRTSFLGKCLSSTTTHKGRRLNADTAGRVFDGDTGISLGTAGLVAKALGAKLDQLFDIKD